MKGMILGTTLAVVAALGVLQLVVLNNAPPPDPAVILQGAETSQRAYAEAIRANDRFLTGVRPSPAEEAAQECEARARMAAAVHRADPAQVREACLFTWRTTGALPR